MAQPMKGYAISDGGGSSAIVTYNEEMTVVMETSRTLPPEYYWQNHRKGF